MPGNTSDKTTLSEFLKKIEDQTGRSNRTWVMDRGIPTEETLAEMRAATPKVHYLVGTPKGRFTQSVRRREGQDLLRSHRCGTDPALLWQYTIQLTEVEPAFKELKGDLSAFVRLTRKKTRESKRNSLSPVGLTFFR